MNFDLSDFFHDKPLDHGCFSPLSMLYERLVVTRVNVTVSIVPLRSGACCNFPVPSAQRCYRLGGGALRRAIESYPEDLRFRRHHYHR